MLHQVTLICAFLPFIYAYPQEQYPILSQTYTNDDEQRPVDAYTDSTADIKIISAAVESSTERGALRPVVKTYKSRARAQQSTSNVQHEPVQPVKIEQPVQMQSWQPVQSAQHQQSQQLEAQYLQRVRSEHSEQQFQQSVVPPHEHRPSSTTYIPILKFDKSQSLDGSYKQSWETGNHIIAEETGYLKNIGAQDQEALVQQGSYTYTAPDGTIITTNYIADESGFHVEGSHLPTPPPIPEEIRKGLEQIYEGIRLQQEADAKEGKTFKYSSGQYSGENSVSNNYPAQYQQYQKDRSQDQQEGRRQGGKVASSEVRETAVRAAAADSKQQ